MKDYIKINEQDNVIVALRKIEKGEVVENVTALEDIERGHKMALVDLKENDNIIKYGAPIGHAKKDIKAGEHIHVQNLKTNLSDVLEYKYEPVEPVELKSEDDYFMGYVRKNGDVGIRNELWIIPTVGCLNSVVTKVEMEAQKYLNDSIDAIVSFRHPYGCSQMGDDQENTREILADLISHPNAGGVLVMGLGCENSNIEEVKKHISWCDEDRTMFMIAQEEDDEVAVALEKIEQLANIMKNDKREKVSVSKLKVGMKCGGSDGLSGITANPTVGAFSDILISKGGTTILTEVPEMFGAETLLMNRCKDEETFDKTVSLINDFKQYFIDHHQVVYENPSPGNKAGGISSLEDKSLGCTQKSGSATVVDVLKYGEKVHTPGLNLLSAPGNDLVASTACAASGCQLVLFTTGRGTPFSSAVPTMKIASNSYLADKKNNWIDFNAGKVVEDSSIELAGKELYDLVIRVANGEYVKAEKQGYHDIAIFKQGVTL